MSFRRVPPEVCDLVVDFLAPDRSAVGLCALVCRAWVSRSRFHLFEYISLTEYDADAATDLNGLLESPHATFMRSVRQLDFFNALAPICPQCRSTSHTVAGSQQTLLSLVPRISQLQNIRTLALSDFPLSILPAFSRVERLYLHGITAGRALLHLAEYFPALRHLALHEVSAIPYHSTTSEPAESNSDEGELALDTVTVRGASVAFLGWLARLAPKTLSLDVGDLVPSEVHYITAYVRQLRAPLQRLRLGLFYDADVEDYLWEELAAALGNETRLEMGVRRDEELERERVECFLRAELPEIWEGGMLEVTRTADYYVAPVNHVNCKRFIHTHTPPT